MVMKLSVLLDLLIMTGVSANCDQNWSYFGGHCYYISGYSRNYYDAFLICQKLDSYLLSITTEEENTFALNDLINCPSCQLWYDCFWIGLRKNFTEWLTLPERRANWTWQSGDPYKWPNWFRGNQEFRPEPSTRYYGYGVMLINGMWGDWDPDLYFRFICEKSGMALTATMPMPSATFSTSVTSETSAIDTKSDLITSWYNGSVGQTYSSHSPRTKLSKNPPATSPQPSEGLPTTTETNNADGRKASSSARGLDKNIYIYIGAALAFLLVTGVAVVVFVALWRRRKLKSPGRPDLPNLTQGQNHGIENGAVTRVDNEYIKLESVTPTAAPYHSLNIHPPPQPTTPHTAPTDGSPQPRPDRAPRDGDLTAVYSVPERRGHDANEDDEEVTVVENTAYTSY